MRTPRILPGLVALILLAACSDDASPEDARASAERDVAMVEAANRAQPPLHEVVPGTIGYPDIERHKMIGEACAYAPGTSIAARVIARRDDAFIKVDGDILRLAADPGSDELPANSRSQYDGRAYSLHLSVEGEGEPVPGSSAVDYSGRMELRDSWGRVVYTGNGLARCGA